MNQNLSHAGCVRLAPISILLCLSGVSHAAVQPNILWLTSEDNSASWMGCYGNTYATTPNIDKLAKEGFLYKNAYANAPVSAPSRCGWLTGIQAVSMGTQPMRSGYDIPKNVILYPEALRQRGYFTANGCKTDYNIQMRGHDNLWDFQPPKDQRFLEEKTDPWRHCPPGKPFFCVINLYETHESQAHGLKNVQHDPKDLTLAAYHPDVPDIRKNYARYYDCVQEMDRKVGIILAALKADGLADNTIVVYCSDHGGVMPRSKRFLFESGIHVPLVIRIPEKFKDLWPAERPGLPVDRMVSYIDMPKTWLSLTGAKIPEMMQGRIFLGPNTEPERQYHFSYRGRMDERIDNDRSVRDKQFIYIKNYMPYVVQGQYHNYLWKMPAMKAWDAEFKAGRTTEVTGRFLTPRTQDEELYDTTNDPDNVKNLVNNPEYAEVLKRMRTGLRQCQEEYFDAGILPESEMVKLAKEHQTTMYELVRNPKWFNHAAILDAADVALEKKTNNLPKLQEYLASKDFGFRFWGAVGCLLLNDAAAPAKPQLLLTLNDSSHEVRAMAAWSLIKLGETEAGYTCLGDLLDKGSYAMLTLLNMVDWMGKDGKPLLQKAMAVNGNKQHAGEMISDLHALYGIKSVSGGGKDKKDKKDKMKDPDLGEDL